MKKIAIIGGGIVGLVSAYYLSSKFKVTIYEKNSDFGGLASSVVGKGWAWEIERNYHHIFKTDRDFISFCEEIGFSDNLFFKTPITSSLYNPKEQSYRLDNPLDLLMFPKLNLLTKLRVGMVILSLKALPHLKILQESRASELFQKLMGKKAWNSLFGELLRKKFGEYAGIISASFFWARIKVRTPHLGYINKGFKNFFIFLTKKILVDRGVVFKNGEEVRGILSYENRYLVNSTAFDLVLSTVPTPIFLKIASKIIPKVEVAKMKQIKYLHSLCLILETKKPYFKSDYWVNIMDKKAPFMVAVAHTNFIDKENYSGNHILYLGQYTNDEKLLNLSKQQLYNYYKPYLKKINPQITDEDLIETYLTKDYYSQPIFQTNFSALLPPSELVNDKLYVANLDMTYPYDRGVNYAVRLGREVSSLILSK